MTSKVLNELQSQNAGEQYPHPFVEIIGKNLKEGFGQPLMFSAQICQSRPDRDRCRRIEVPDQIQDFTLPLGLRVERTSVRSVGIKLAIGDPQLSVPNLFRVIPAVGAAKSFEPSFHKIQGATRPVSSVADPQAQQTLA